MILQFYLYLILEASCKQVFMGSHTAIIETERLILRQWQNQDLEPFALMNGDPRVMEFFPSTLSKKESDDLAKRITDKIREQSWGLWAVSIPQIAEFIGFIGLAKPTFEAHFTPAVEIGWRLGFDYWGKGYATEGAKAVLKYGFEKLLLNEIVSFTSVQNMRSRKVMEKIGLHHDMKDDFDHPKIPLGHPLRRHALYRLNNVDFSRSPK
jgi:3-dehydroquinate dehydratase/shikimate dehydrogenase